MQSPWTHCACQPPVQVVGAGDEKHSNELIEDRRVMAVVWGPEQPPTTLVSPAA